VGEVELGRALNSRSSYLNGAENMGMISDSMTDDDGLSIGPQRG